MAGSAVPFDAQQCTTSPASHIIVHIDTAVRVYCISWSDLLPNVNHNHAEGQAHAMHSP